MVTKALRERELGIKFFGAIPPRERFLVRIGVAGVCYPDLVIRKNRVAIR
jgi:hypothetical protein